MNGLNLSSVKEQSDIIQELNQSVFEDRLQQLFHSHFLSDKVS